MSWSTAQVVRISRVTSRALRHYHAIGLLPPARVGGNGIRYYEREQLLQLQQIMLLRELGLGLDAITRIVNERADPVEQLSRHQRWLAEERDRLDRLARTVARTIEDLKGGEKMSTDKLFEGFDAEKQARYEAELVQRYGPDVQPHIAESKRRMAEPGRADAVKAARDWAAVGEALVPLIDDGARPEDPRVQEVIAGHHRWLLNFWTPNRESYTGLGQLYVDSPEFKAQLDAVDPRLAEFLRDSMAAYALTNLE